MGRTRGAKQGEAGVDPARQEARRNDVARSIGIQVRTLRRHLELTAAETCRRAGLSPGMLSKIERGQAVPSVLALAALAEALGVPVARFFAGHDERHDCSFVRAGQGVKVERSGTRAGHDYQLLGHSLSGALFVEPYLVTTHAAAKPYNSFQHKGVEFLYVLEGAMRYRYADRLLDLREGDALLFDSTAMHGPEELGTKPLRYLSIVVNLRA